MPPPPNSNLSSSSSSLLQLVRQFADDLMPGEFRLMKRDKEEEEDNVGNRPPG